MKQLTLILAILIAGCSQPKLTTSGPGWEYDPNPKMVDVGDTIIELTTLYIDFSYVPTDSDCGCPEGTPTAYADYENGLYSECPMCFIIDHDINHCDNGKIHRIVSDLEDAGYTVSLDSVKGLVKELTGLKRNLWTSNDAIDGCICVNCEIHEDFPEYGEVYDNATFRFILWDQINGVQIVNEAHLDNILYLSFSFY